MLSIKNKLPCLFFRFATFALVATLSNSANAQLYCTAGNYYTYASADDMRNASKDIVYEKIVEYAQKKDETLKLENIDSSCFYESDAKAKNSAERLSKYELVKINFSALKIYGFCKANTGRFESKKSDFITKISPIKKWSEYAISSKKFSFQDFPWSRYEDYLILDRGLQEDLNVKCFESENTKKLARLWIDSISDKTVIDNFTNVPRKQTEEEIKKLSDVRRARLTGFLTVVDNNVPAEIRKSADEARASAELHRSAQEIKDAEIKAAVEAREKKTKEENEKRNRERLISCYGSVEAAKKAPVSCQ